MKRLVPLAAILLLAACAAHQATTPVAPVSTSSPVQPGAKATTAARHESAPSEAVR